MEQPLLLRQEEAEQILSLFDTYWFDRLVLFSLPPPPSSPAPAPLQGLPETKKEVQQSSLGLRHRRSRSDEAAAASFEGLEPLKIQGNRVRLETILSGKDDVMAEPLPERRRPEALPPRGRRRRRRGRSMSELEFEEVKGLQDLGFTFSDAEVDAELASIVPGLRHRWSEEEAEQMKAAGQVEVRRVSDVAAAAVAPRRPYLSEAWDARDEEEEEVRRLLRNWRVPAAGEGVDLKEHLRLWAHTVASAVR